MDRAQSFEHFETLAETPEAVEKLRMESEIDLEGKT